MIDLDVILGNRASQLDRFQLLKFDSVEPIHFKEPFKNLLMSVDVQHVDKLERH